MAKKKEEAPKAEAEKDAAAPAAEGGEAPAEGAEGAPAEGEGAKAGGKKKLIIIVAGVVVLLLGAGAGLYFTGMLDSVLGKKVEEGAEGEHGEEAAAEGDHGEAAAGGGGHGEAGGSNFLEIPTITVNLQADDGTPRYLRLSVQLELKNALDKASVEAVMPRVIDQFQTYLRELRVRDLRGSAGIYRLQMELLWRVNQAASPVEVKDVLFQEILIN